MMTATGTALVDRLMKVMDSTFALCTGLPSEPLPEKQVELLKQAKEDTPTVVYPNEAPMVKLSAKQLKQFTAKRKASILLKSLQSIPHALHRAVFHKSPVSLTDDQLVQCIDQTSMHMLCKQKSNNKKRLYCIDLKRFYELPTFTGFCCMGTIANFTQDSKTSSLRSLSSKLKLDNIVLYPSTGENFIVKPSDSAWDFAKLMLMHNLNHEITLGKHAMTHFPTNSLIVLTAQWLPESNAVYQFLQPHFRYTLGINNLVLNSSASILVDHNNLASPFDIPFDTVHKFNIQPAYKEYRFLARPLYNSKFTYGRMMQSYWNSFRPLVQQLVTTYVDAEKQAKSKQAQHLKRWADRVSRIIRGFPSGKEVTRSTDVLIDTLTTIAVTVSIDHSSQHYTYAQIPSTGKPWRIRSRVPLNANDAIHLSSMNWYVDAFQEEAANRVFFNVDPASQLIHVKYYNENKQVLELDYLGFRKRLQKCAEKFPHVPLEKIAPSIDF